MNKRYNNYHKHDRLSSIFGVPDSATSQKEYIERCVELGHTNYFTTNHGSFGDIFEANTLCEQYGLKCIAGIEGYIVPDASENDRRNYHIVIIPKTDKARKKMNYVSSRANIDGFFAKKPRIFLDDLLALDSDDIFLTTACEGGLLKDKDSINEIFIPLAKHFGKNMMLEVQNHLTESQKEINKKAIYYAEKLGLELICANDSHYIDESGKIARNKLLKGKHIQFTNEEDYILDFPDYDTMVARFKKQGILTDEQIERAMQNTLLFDVCEPIKIDREIKMPNIYKELNPNQRVAKLKKLINNDFKKLKERENLSKEEVALRIDGLKSEMKVIEETNDVIHTADYFLFNERMVDIAVNKYGGVLTRGGRGSAPSFYTNKVLGITQVDRFNAPIKMYSERFMSTARLLENRALPDIDFNVSKQEPFVKASRDLLGKHGCYPMIAYGCMGESDAFRNTCREKGLEFEKFNEVGKNLDAYRDDPYWKPIIEEAQKQVGIIVSASVHPCAFCLSDKNILEEYGVVRIGDALCVMVTSLEADEYKILKNDYLIVSVWTLISETFKELGQPIIDAPTLLKRIENDERIWKLYEDGITCTLNQVDSDYGTQICKKYKPKNMAETSMLTAILRPFFDSWREQFLTKEAYDTGCKQLNDLFAPTHGYLCFQENLMQYFEFLGEPPAVSIGLIKKISKKKIKQEDFDKLENDIKKVWFEKIGTYDGFDENWKLIQKCMAYGFCSSHAYATALDMGYGAYLKVNHPLEYYSVCFNHYQNDERRTKILTKELDYFGIKLKDVKFRYSKGSYFYDKKTNSIYKGIGSIKFLNAEVGDMLYSLRLNVYGTFVDLLNDFVGKNIDNRQITILIKMGYFSEFGSIKKLLATLDIFNKWHGKSTINKGKISELGLDGIDLSKYGNDKSATTGKETKTYRNLDVIGLIRELSNRLPNDEYAPIQLIKFQIEVKGKSDVIDTTIPKNVGVVANVETNKWGTTFFHVYVPYTGNTVEFKVDKMALAELGKPDVCDVIIATGITSKDKKKKVGDKWVKTGEVEKIITGWETCDVE